MSASDETPPSAGRTRRSAAIKGKNAWSSLLPQKKGSGGVSSDVESENVEETAGKKETPKQTQVPVETVSQKRARVSGKKPRLSKAEKVNSQAEMSPSAESIKTTESKSPAKISQSSPAKSPVAAPGVPASPAAKKEGAPAVVHQKASSPAKPKSTPAAAIAPASAVRPPYRTPQSYSMNAGSAAALNKEQLQEIEREVDKHLDGEFDGNDEEDFEQDEGTTKFVLDDPDDEDFNLSSKKSSTKRKSNPDAPFPASSRTYSSRGGGQAGRSRGRPKGSLNIPKPAGTGIMRGIGKIGSRPSSLGTPPTMMARPPTSNGTPKSFGVARDGDGPAPNNSSNQVDRRNLKVVRIRQLGAPPQQAAHRPTAGGGGAVTYQPSTTSLNREISEISEKYHNRVVPGSTVQQFNDIVNQMSQELTRMVNEQTNHRQYTDQLALTHATEMELKDEKIRHLEHTIEMLQSKLLVSYKKNQLNVLKHETRPDPASAADKQNDKPNGGVLYGSNPANEVQKKRLMQDPEEFEHIRKVPRFNKDFEEHDEEEELFSGSGLDGDDEDDTEVDEEARQVTL